MLSGLNSQPLPAFFFFLSVPYLCVSALSHLFPFIFFFSCHLLLTLYPLPPSDLSPTAKTSAEEDTRAAGRPRHHASWVTPSRHTHAGTRQHFSGWTGATRRPVTSRWDANRHKRSPDWDRSYHAESVGFSSSRSWDELVFWKSGSCW